MMQATPDATPAANAAPVKDYYAAFNAYRGNSRGDERSALSAVITSAISDWAVAMHRQDGVSFGAPAIPASPPPDLPASMTQVIAEQMQRPRPWGAGLVRPAAAMTRGLHAAEIALEAHAGALGIVGDNGTQLTHLLVSLIDHARACDVSFDEALADARDILRDNVQPTLRP